MANDSILLFARKEIKYILTEEKYQAVKQKILPYVTPDDYGQYTICNVYFDNDNFDLIRTSLSKPKFKQKLRVRSYGIPTDDGKVFFEIKKKYKGIVYKRRIKIPYREFKDYIFNGVPPKGHVNDRTFKEIDNFKKQYDLVPKVYLAYDREAYFANDNPDFRITFDKNIRSRRKDVLYEGGDENYDLLRFEGKYIMELKAGDAIPLWLVRILNSVGVFKGSFSKYGRVYLSGINDKAPVRSLNKSEKTSVERARY